MNGGPVGETARRCASVVLIDKALVHQDRAFTYLIPDGVGVDIGSLVRVPVRGKRRIGVVADLLDRPDIDHPVPLVGTVGPGLPASIVRLALWTAERYLSTSGEALAAAIPRRVAGQESTVHREPFVYPPVSPADPRLRHWMSLTRAIEAGGHAGFVVRTSPFTDRGALVVSLVAAALGAGRGVLVLLPEVATRGGVGAALEEAFGDGVAWVGSDREPKERYRAWLALRRGEKRLAVGGRAAVFAPVDPLGLVVVDDESHHSYKEGRAPRFHARTVAAERARAERAAVVLLGAPPSAEAHEAANGPYRLVAASREAERAERRPVIVVDRTKQDSSATPAPYSLTLARRAIAAGERVAVLAHRGGAELHAIARRTAKALERSPAVLDSSRSSSAVIAASAGAPLVVATPVIAKDLVVEGVGLLLIVEADAALADPGFRAQEETFGSWWRAARWVPSGSVVLETTQPAHPAVRALARWEPDILWEADAARRRELGYPPFASLARIDAPADRADDVAEQIRAAGLDVLGPLVRDGRGVVVARAEKRGDLLDRLRPLAMRWRAAEEPMRVDVDPWEVLEPRWRS